jgi:hypothetical protein
MSRPSYGEPRNKGTAHFRGGAEERLEVLFSGHGAGLIGFSYGKKKSSTPHLPSHTSQARHPKHVQGCLASVVFLFSYYIIVVYCDIYKSSYNIS